jgi:tetratricopeptide (TPR) repeat protein
MWGEPRRPRRVPSTDRIPTIAQLGSMLTEFEQAAVEAYVQFDDQAGRIGSPVAQSIASTELLKFFRVFPADFTSQFPVPAYFGALIAFIESQESSSVALSDNSVFQLALCHLALGDAFRAYNYISRYSAPESSPEVAFVAGFCSFATGRLRVASRFLAIGAESQDDLIAFDSNLCRAIIFLREREYAASRDLFGRLAELRHPLFTPLDMRFHFGVLSFYADDEAMYQRVMDEIDNDVVNHQRAYFETLRGQYDLALQYFQRIRAGVMSFDRLFLITYIKYRQGAYPYAFQHMRKLFHPETEKNHNVWALLGLIMARGGQLPDAATILNNANVMQPGSGLLEKNLGAVLEMRQRWDEAEIVYRKMIDGERLVGYAQFRLSSIQYAKSRMPEYEQPEIEDIPLDQLIPSPADEKLTKFQTTLVLFSKQMTQFIGDIDPEITEVHKSITIFREALDAGFSNGGTDQPEDRQIRRSRLFS